MHKQIYPNDRKQCHRCDSSNNKRCESAPRSQSICPTYAPDDFCTAKLVDGVTYRGCATDFQCDDTDKQVCRHCNDDDNCNTVDLKSLNIGYPGNWQDPPINCYKCLDEECKDGNSAMVNQCEGNVNQNCVTVFNAQKKVVQRGCSNDLYSNKYASYCDKNPDNCKFCKSNGCNDATELTAFETCVFCEARTNPACISNPDDIKTTRSCAGGCMMAMYPRSDEDNPPFEFTRSCLDDLDIDEREDCENGKMKYCKSCKGPRCNTDLMEIERRKCKRCKEGDCEEMVDSECTAYRENDQCYVEYVNGDVTNMGCASDLDTSYLTANKRNLYLCDEDNCNDFNLLPWLIKCRFCNSKDDPNCAIEPEGVESKQCSGLPSAECFIYVDTG